MIKTPYGYAHVKWILRNLLELKRGILPDEPRPDIDYGAIQKNHRGFTLGAFEDAAYIEVRLKECGDMDALLCKAKYSWDENMEYWSAFFQLSMRDINKRINKTLKYIVEKSRGET